MDEEKEIDLRDLVNRIKKMYPIISQVMPLSLEEWVDGFFSDQHPEQEVVIWERISERVDRKWKLAEAKTKEQKVEIFKRIIQKEGWGEMWYI